MEYTWMFSDLFPSFKCWLHPTRLILWPREKNTALVSPSWSSTSSFNWLLAQTLSGKMSSFLQPRWALSSLWHHSSLGSLQLSISFSHTPAQPGSHSRLTWSFFLPHHHYPLLRTPETLCLHSSHLPVYINWRIQGVRYLTFEGAAEIHEETRSFKNSRMWLRRCIVHI